MAWRELRYYRGWTGYWNSDDHRMYAKPGAWGDTKHFHERPKDFDTAWAVFRAWVDRQ